MRGEFVAVWSDLWRSVWVPLSRHPEFGSDLFVDLHREFIPPPAPPKPIVDMAEEEFIQFQGVQKRYEEIVGDPGRARTAFRRWFSAKVTTEADAISFLERSYGVIETYGDQAYLSSYVSRVERFIEKFSLRYDLRRPFTIHLTLPGIFTKLIREVKVITQADPHLCSLMAEFEDAIRDLRTDSSAGRIKTCIQKQFNLMEAMGRLCPDVTQRTLGKICDQLGTWPHDKVKEAMQSLYGFASDYPGIRHGGTAASALRDMEMRDLISLSILLVGFTPYLSHSVNAEVVFRGQ